MKTITVSHIYFVAAHAATLELPAASRARLEKCDALQMAWRTGNWPLLNILPPVPKDVADAEKMVADDPLIQVAMKLHQMGIDASIEERAERRKTENAQISETSR